MVSKGAYVTLIVIGMFLIIVGVRLRDQAKEEALAALDEAEGQLDDVAQGDDEGFKDSIEKAEDADDTEDLGNISIVLGILAFIVGLAGSIEIFEIGNRGTTKPKDNTELNNNENESEDNTEPDIDISDISNPEILYDLAVEMLNKGKSNELVVDIYNKALNNGLSDEHGGPEREKLSKMRFEMYDFELDV